MNVIYVNPQSFSNSGLYDYNLLRHLRLQNMTFYGSSKFEHEDRIPYRFRGVFRYNSKSGINKGSSYVLSQLTVLAAVARYRPDIVHYQWFKAPTADSVVLSVMSLVSPQTKIVHTAHNLLPHDSGERYRTVFNRIYRRLDAIIVHSAQTKEELKNQFGIDDIRIHVIPHGLIDLKGETAFVPDPSFRKAIKPRGETVFGMLGNVCRYKGVDIALEAWTDSQALRNNPNVRLLIAGRNYDIDLPEDVPDNVTIVDRYLSEMEYLQYLALVDVMLCPHRTISQSGVLMAALHERLPVVVSPIGGLREPFDIGSVGWILEELSVECLRGTLERIAASEKVELSVSKSDPVWNRIEHFYSWHRIGQMTLDLYRSLTTE